MEFIKSIFLLFGILTLLSACNTEAAMDNDRILTVTNGSKSSTIETFEKLNLGILLDFEYKWEQADKTWIHIWAEGYHNGEKVEPNLTELNYGLHPSEEVVDGNLSLGFIETNEGPFIFLSSNSASITPQKLNLELLDSKGASAWDYAIHEKLSADLDETIILGVYRETSGNTLNAGYDYQDEEEIQRMIEKYDRLILFKMKVVKDNE